MSEVSAERSLPSISQHNFHNVQQEGRVRRRSTKDRDIRSKLVLGNRIEGHERIDVRKDGIENTLSSAGWISNAERLRCDVGNEVRKIDQNRKQHRQALWDSNRKTRINREASRWERITKEEQLKTHKSQEIVGQSKRNRSSVRYHLINHIYSDSKSAADAKYKDDCIKFTATTRTKQLYERGNLSGYNIINGEQRPHNFVQVPPVPQKADVC